MLPEAATICPKCKSYQNPWKNHLRYASSIVGLFSVFGAAIVYMVTAFPDLRKVVNWRTDVRVLAFNSGKHIAILNSGDGPVLISHVALEVQNNATKTFSINRIVQPNELLTHQFNADDYGKGYRIVNGELSEAEWQRATDAAVLNADGNCYSISVHSEQDPAFQMYMEVGGRNPRPFRTMPASAVLHLYDLRKGTQQFNIPVSALVWHLAGCDDADTASPTH